MINNRTACQLVATAADAVAARPENYGEVLESIPAAIYVTDAEGTLAYYNPACVELAGRTPRVGEDKWCVSWKLYTADGEPLPHEACPMAEALREKRPIRDVEAVAERPDGTLVHFVPYPTPVFDEDGECAGAVNLLLDVTSQRKPDYLLDRADHYRRLAADLADRGAAETLTLMAAKYEEQARRLA